MIDSKDTKLLFLFNASTLRVNSIATKVKADIGGLRTIAVFYKQCCTMPKRQDTAIGKRHIIIPCIAMRSVPFLAKACSTKNTKGKLCPFVLSSPSWKALGVAESSRPAGVPC